MMGYTDRHCKYIGCRQELPEGKNDFCSEACMLKQTKVRLVLAERPLPGIGVGYEGFNAGVKKNGKKMPLDKLN